MKITRARLRQIIKEEIRNASYLISDIKDESGKEATSGTSSEKGKTSSGTKWKNIGDKHKEIGHDEFTAGWKHWKTPEMDPTEEAKGRHEFAILGKASELEKKYGTPPSKGGIIKTAMKKYLDHEKKAVSQKC